MKENEFSTKMGRFLQVQFLVLCLFLASVGTGISQSDEISVVRPAEIDDILVNPGMGITTFQRFNRQAINPGRRWSEVGPEGPIEDASAATDFPETSIAYLRWFWSQIEPEEGEYRWDIIDSALEEARKHDQQLMVRIMPYDQNNPLPEWYRESGARRANRESDSDGEIWSPDADDPLYLQRWGALVREFGTRYDGHPYLDTVDISTVGYWGEGWGPYLPSWATQAVLIDLYIEAFQRTQLLMNFDELKALAYGTQYGAGWRLDCWGDTGRPGRDFAHMFDAYPQGVVQAGVQEVWRHSPVALETCGTPGSWVNWGVPLDYVMDQALRWHASTINIKSSAIPEQWKPAFDEFQKKIGYRFILRKLTYATAVGRGRMVPVSMWWFNAGVSPVYYDYILSLRLKGDSDQAVIELPIDVKTWLPGDSVFDSTVFVPYSLEPGSYRLGLALLSPRSRQPAIKLAIKGLQPDGWYDLGEIQVID